MGSVDGREEKNSRSALKAAVEKAVNAKTIVVLDALNYIKGVRYELFCKAKAESTTYCVVYVDTPLSLALERNASREDAFDPQLYVCIVREKRLICGSVAQSPSLTLQQD